VAEALSATEVGAMLAEHGRPGEQSPHHHDRLISIIEAVLLSVVTLTAAWSGYSAAKWTTHSSLQLAQASAERSDANRAYQEALTERTQDAANFNAWFTAYIAGDERGERVAERRFRDQYHVAFRAWLATRPFTDPNAPKGPQYMPLYKPTGEVEAARLDAAAEASYAEGEHAAIVGDDYIRVTVILASVLFLVGISSHFVLRAVRFGLVSVGTLLLLAAAVEILRLPGPPH
jgi:hypothetical protein